MFGHQASKKARLNERQGTLFVDIDLARCRFVVSLPARVFVCVRAPVRRR